MRSPWSSGDNDAQIVDSAMWQSGRELEDDLASSAKMIQAARRAIFHSYGDRSHAVTEAQWAILAHSRVPGDSDMSPERESEWVREGAHHLINSLIDEDRKS